MSSRFLGSLAAGFVVLAGCSSKDDHGKEFPFVATPTWTNASVALASGAVQLTPANFTSVRAGNASQVVVAGEQTAIFRSDDGGATWTQHEHSPLSRGGDVLAMDSGGTSFLAVGRDKVPARGSRWWRAAEDVRYWVTSDVDDMDASDNGEPATAVDLVAGDLAFILREDGKILYGSTVGGQVFDADASGTLKWYAIDFIGLSGTGHVAGESAKIRKSTDGGLTWLPDPAMPASIPGTTVWRKLGLIVTTPNPLAYTVYACGGGGKVVKSVDSGVNWTDVSTSSGVVLRSMHFPVDASTGWVVGDGGTIYKTTTGGTGGTPWTLQSITPATTADLHDIFMVNNTEGFVVGKNGTVARTLDGGATWTLLTTGGASGVAFRAVDFTPDGSRGVAVSSTGHVYKTLNGGGLWTLSTQIGGNPALTGVSIPRSGSGLVAYVCGGTAAVYRNLDLTTSDTWTLQSLPAAFNPKAILFPGGDDVGFVAGDNASLYTTTDGTTGGTWAAVAGFPAGATAYHSLDAFGTTLVAGGVGGGLGRIAFTLDSGTSWFADASSGETTAFQGLSVPGMGDAFALAADGSIWKAAISAPSTVSWSAVTGALPSGFTAPPVAMAWTSTSNGLLVSAGAGVDAIAVTTDGGATWSSSFEHVAVPLRAIRGVSSTTLWVVGDSGVLLVTSTGGL